MKTIGLRQLLRAPRQVKRWTRAGQKVQVTDKGKPLWVIQPAASQENEAARGRSIDELLDELLREPRSKISLSKILEESRR